MGVDLGHAVAHGDGPVLAGPDTVAHAHAAKAAAGDASGQERRGRAALDAVVHHFVGGVVVAAQAVDQGGLVGDLHVAAAQDLGALFGHLGPAGGAQAGLCLTLGHGRRVPRAAGETAGAAVGPGQHLLQGLGGLVLGHGHHHRGHRQDDPGQQADDPHDEDGS